MTLLEWDEVKAESNLRKHGISFDDAIEVFFPTLCLNMTAWWMAKCGVGPSEGAQG
jgi:uncharacterized DUF497 family protein